MDKELQTKLLQYLLPHHPVRVGVFGSFARGENRDGSDLDILVKFKDRISLLKLVQIEQELSDKLEISIDLVTENSLKNPLLRKYIEKDLITIYEWKRTIGYLDHIVKSFSKVVEYLEDAGYEAFLADEEKQDAIIRKIEVAGEATKRLSLGLREK